MFKTDVAWYMDAPKKVHKDWTTEERNNLLEMNEMGLSSDEIIQAMGGRITKIQIYNQVRIAKKIRAKKCYQCGTPSSRLSKNGLVICKKCMKENGQYKKSLREKALKNGLCGVCYKNKLLPGHTSCRRCISATHRRRVAQGLCGKCGRRRIAENSNSLCTVCLTINGQFSNEWREERK